MSKKISQLAAAASLTGEELLEVSKLSASVTITAATISAAATDNSFNDSGSGFVAAGFAVGDQVKVTGFTGNTANNIFSARVTALTAGKMTIGGSDGDVIVDDAAGETVTIMKWESKRTSAADLAASGSDVTAAANLTNDKIVRGDGGVKGVQTTGVEISDADEISGYKGNVKLTTASSYTLLAADSGKVLEFSDGTGVALDMPNNLPVGWCATVGQVGAGAVTFTPASGATRRNRQSHTKTAGQWALCMLYVRTNSGGSAAEYVLGGDTAA